MERSGGRWPLAGGRYYRWDLSGLAGGLVVLAAALLYLLTLDNGLRPDELIGGDLITHQYAQVEARPGNAPGYPLYTMGGWLWFHLGRALLSTIFNPVQILSLYSTLWGLASLLVLYLILLRVTGRQWLIAFPLTAFYATTFFFWYYSVTTEQYTSAVFQTLLIIWLAFRWDEHPRQAGLLWLAFISGTMLANMVTTLFILPPLLWFIFFRPVQVEGRQGLMFTGYLQKPKLILQAIGLALLPLLSYAYVYIRGAQHPEWRGAGTWPTTWQWFVQFVTIQQGRDELAPGLSLHTLFTAEFPALMWQELTWLVFWGGLLGLATLGRRRAIFLYSTLLIYFLFAWGYRFGNWFQVIIPAYPIIIIGFAAGLSRVNGVRRRGGEEARRRGGEEQGSRGAGEQGSRGAGEQGVGSGERGAGSGERGAGSEERRGGGGERAGFAGRLVHGGVNRPPVTPPSIPPLAGGLLKPLSRWRGEVGGGYPWGYLRRDVLIITFFFLTALVGYRFITGLPRANQHNLPGDTGLDPGWAILADNPLAPAVISGDFEEEVALQYLVTVWGAASGLYPTGAGQLQPPPGLKAGDLPIYLSRRALAAAPQAVPLGQASLQAAGEQLIALWPQPRFELPAGAAPLDLNFGDKLELMGWEAIPAADWLPETVARRLPRANWQIALYWRAAAPLAEDYTISVRPLVSGQLLRAGQAAIIQDHQPVWGAYPTGRWRPGEVVRDVYALSLPAAAVPDAVQIVVYKTTGGGFENLAERIISLPPLSQPAGLPFTSPH